MAKRLGLVVAEFNRDIVETMVMAATDEAKLLKTDLAIVQRVPGCYEVPLIVQSLLRRGNVDAVVVLGYVERGETLHGEVMGHVVHNALMRMSLELNKPVGVGIIGPGATLEQAAARKDGYARAAVRAAVAALTVLDE
jgi:6,7-dimethyl-8-ribityllumazine synthase